MYTVRSGASEERFACSLYILIVELLNSHSYSPTQVISSFAAHSVYSPNMLFKVNTSSSSHNRTALRRSNRVS